MNPGDILKLVASILICEGAGGIGAIFTVWRIPTWYATLRKPAFTPPNRLFGPIWIALYLLMGVAVFLVWRGLNAGTLIVFIIFWLQLLVNVLWSVVFFGFKSPGGVFVIIMLWILILACIISFFGVSAVAGALLIPYIIWVTIAALLNIQIWRLNG